MILVPLHLQDSIKTLLSLFGITHQSLIRLSQTVGSCGNNLGTMKEPTVISSFFLLTVFIFSQSSSLFIYADSSDHETLLNLKSSLIGSSGSGLEDWDASSPSQHCSFSGVTCDSNSKVVSLNITSVPLLGVIPPVIGQLYNLVNLTLACNNLTGPFPVEIFNLTSLKYLNLSCNQINGSFPDSGLSQLTELEVFDVYNNNLSGPLPVEFVELKKLRVLYLAGNYFDGEIPYIYGGFESLKILALQGNSLTGRIPKSLARIKGLEEMYLGYFNTYEGGIPEEFGEIETLKLLSLGMCNLTGEIPASLGNLKHLHTLFLQVNNLSGHIPPELSGLVSLMSLDLSINSLSGRIPETFSELKNLTLINLFQNKLEGPLPSFIGDLPNLEVLQIWDNNFTMSLPENLGSTGRLLFIDVTNNHLTGTIPKDLCRGGKLKMLILMKNFFYGPLPDELGGCKSLTKIRIKENFLNGTIPSGFFSLPLLFMLELNDNYFTGELPQEMSASTLGNIELSNNLIKGRIPSGIKNLINLEILSLANNKFDGDIPNEVFDLKKLTKLNVSGNSFTGEIPSSVARSSHLTFIDLSRNRFDGKIPKTISGLQNLNVLNLSRNGLDREIPGEIGLMKSLTVLDLSYNSFSGRRPSSGLLKDLDERYFAGNPNLCKPNASFCSSDHGPSSFSVKRHYLKITIIVATSTILVLLLLPGLFIALRRIHLERSRSWKLTVFQRLDFRAEEVIDCLKEENIIGKGGAGIVYRGSMPNGIDVAIKHLTGRSNSRNDHGFMAEIQTLGRIRHRNIVRLLGYVSNKDTNLLLYEYMSHGSLGDMLHGSKGAHLQWESRYRIALEAARGLCYLHHDCSPSIIHRDVKCNNILLDSDYEAHVADFGLAKFLQDAGASECMSSIAGSYGYIAPEYAYTLKVDQKSDVYSFGVVLLELITGKKPVGEFGEGMDIVRWVRKVVSELSEPPSDDVSARAIIDPRLKGYPMSSVVNLFRIAMRCVEDNSSDRPTMREVVYMLTNPPQQASHKLITT